MFGISDTERIKFGRVVVPLFFVIGILLSWKLWGSDRLFPLCPIIDGIPIFSGEVGLVLASLLVSLLILTGLYPKRWLFGVLFVLLLFLLIQDQVRWQPWVYLYFFLLLPGLYLMTNVDNNLS